MLTSLLAPILPYLIGASVIGGIGLFLYVKYLISSNKKLKQDLQNAVAAYNNMVSQYQQMKVNYDTYIEKFRTQTEHDAAAAGSVTGAKQAAGQMPVDPSDTLTKDDIANIDRVSRSPFYPKG